MEVFCGIDWAEDHHDIVIVDRDGQLLARRRISDDAAVEDDVGLRTCKDLASRFICGGSVRLTNVEPQSRSVMRLLGADAAWFREPHPSDPRGHDVPHGDCVRTSLDTAVTVNGRCQA